MGREMCERKAVGREKVMVGSDEDRVRGGGGGEEG